MAFSKNCLMRALALGLLVLLGGGLSRADTLGIHGIGGTQWNGDKMKAKNTPTLAAIVEIPIDSFPEGASVGVEMRCEINAAKGGGTKPVKKVKGKAEYSFYGRSAGAPDTREPLGTSFAARYATGRDGVAVFRDQVPIPLDYSPASVGVEVRTTHTNGKKIDTTSDLCDLTSVVTIAISSPEE